MGLDLKIKEGKLGSAMGLSALCMLVDIAKRTGKCVISNFSFKKEYRTFTEDDLVIKVNAPVDTSEGYILIDDVIKPIGGRG